MAVRGTLEKVPGDRGVDPTVADPSLAHPTVLEDAHINNFGYQDNDPDGHLMPLAAHIRKVNPRDQSNPGRDESIRHRIARRGITYGPEFVDTETPYGAGPVPDNQDRGLLFLCYQSSIAKGFEFIQSQWANQPDFPTTTVGEDPIGSQNNPNVPFTLGNVHLVTQPGVTTAGGEYFIAPSIAGIRHLGGQP